MKFAHSEWLFGALFALVIAALLVAGGLGLSRALKRFGDVERVREMVTSDATRRRAYKAVLLVLATAFAFVALARPQYGRGTRLVPATNLDVAIVLDYSKSMYAKDVTPSRIARAKAEVDRLIRDLRGARFGAVAFAGEPIAFPLTSDGAAIAQFFRQMEPNDMPIGGTAIARALERARELLTRDPKSRDHSRVILLVTDGEDLEGDPVEVARSAGQEGTIVHVVQIGGRTPERIPDVGPDGRVTGWRKDEDGKPLTTELSAEGEAQLAQIAAVAGGQIVRSEKGVTGIDKIARELKRFMTDELAERVETIYADVYAYPLGVAILLLVVETFIGDAPRRRRNVKRTLNGTPSKTATIAAVITLLFGAIGCGFNPFERNAPQVHLAIGEIDGGDASTAVGLLEHYLETGECSQGSIGIPDRLHTRPKATFDLGLALFRVGEAFGRRFGDEETGSDAGPSQAEQQLSTLRGAQIDCALRIVLPLAIDVDSPTTLRARAHYLAGNLEFLRKQYDEAVRHYDEALKLVPGMGDAGDTVGNDAAFNRSIALERSEEEKKRDAGADSGPPGDGSADGDGGTSAPQPDGGKGPRGDGGGNNGRPDAKAPDEPDGGGSASPEAAPPPPSPSASDAPPPPANQDERILDSLEQAPTFQQQAAKNLAARHHGRGMQDK